MTQKYYKVEFTINPSEFFDMVQKVGQQTAGARLLGTFLQASTGSLGLLDLVGLSVYGITAGDVQKIDDDLFIMLGRRAGDGQIELMSGHGRLQAAFRSGVPMVEIDIEGEGRTTLRLTKNGYEEEKKAIKSSCHMTVFWLN
jgi:hypothetical protein